MCAQCQPNRSLIGRIQFRMILRIRLSVASRVILASRINHSHMYRFSYRLNAYRSKGPPDFSLCFKILNMGCAFFGSLVCKKRCLSLGFPMS